MFYFIFKKVYFSIRDRMNLDNKKRYDDAKLIKGIKKSTYSYKDNLKFNIYERENADDKELIIDIHGGGWIAGDRDSNNAFCIFLANSGFKVVSFDYSLIDKYTIKEQIEDVFYFINYLTANKEKYNLDFNKVSLMGDSAGGQLALLCYQINNKKDLQVLFDLKPFRLNIKSLILNHAVCYLDKAAKLRNNYLLGKFLAIPGLLRMLYGKHYKRKILYQKTVNPLVYLSKEDKIPPVLIISSSGDLDYSYQSEELACLLKVLDKEYDFYYVNKKEAKHIFNISNINNEESIKCNNYLIKFIRENY